MIRFERFAPPGEENPGWLDEIGELRGRVLFENGRRPAFRHADGRFMDADPLDRRAHHVLARVSGKDVGCVRILPVSECQSTLTERLIGSQRYSEMFRSVGIDLRRGIEGGRWVVDPEHRSARLGVLLAAGGVALARALGYGMLFCPTGTRGRQDRVLARLGFAEIAGQPLIPAPAFDDELRILYCFPDRPTDHFRKQMDAMARELRLGVNRPPRISYYPLPERETSIAVTSGAV